MLRVNPFEQQVVARLLDFFSWRAPWHRSLWSPGVRLILEEVLKAAEACEHGILSRESLKNLAETAQQVAGPDAGCGDQVLRNLLRESLRGELKVRSMDYHTIETIAADIDSHYLERWSKLLATNPVPASVERTARALASYLLDLGFNPDYLHRWWVRRIRYEPSQSTLSDLVTEAHTLSQGPEETYEVLVAFDAIPRMHQIPPDWMDAPTVSKWLLEHGFQITGVRQNGGLLMRISARDPYASVEAARDRVENFAARVAAGTYGELKALPKAWVRSEPKPFQLARPGRGAEIHSLQRENQLYTDRDASGVDAAIALLRPLSTGTTSAAIAGAWAAIETLLCGPGDRERVEAADRLATIVACSFPRAELTQLSYIVEKAGGPLAAKLSKCSTNRERSRVLAEAIASGDALSLVDPSDEAALARLKTMSSNPRVAIQDVRRYVDAAFRRLYRCRNLILHGGLLAGPIQGSCLRTTAPLVGAGIDRIAHAWFIDGTEPRRFAAKARVSLELIAAGGANLVDLLE
jgi:hypothetical protein